MEQRLPPIARGKMGMFTIEKVDMTPPLVGWLVPLSGQQGGATILLDVFSMLGSRRTSEVHLDLPDVEDDHCSILRGSESYILRDLATRLGTEVNGHRISGEHELVDGDEISVAGFRLVFKSSR
jgi:FHA domain